MVRSPSSTLRTSDQAACPHQRSTHRLRRRQRPPGHQPLQGAMSHGGRDEVPTRASGGAGGAGSGSRRGGLTSRHWTGTHQPDASSPPRCDDRLSPGQKMSTLREGRQRVAEVWTPAVRDGTVPLHTWRGGAGRSPRYGRKRADLASAGLAASGRRPRPIWGADRTYGLVVTAMVVGTSSIQVFPGLRGMTWPAASR